MRILIVSGSLPPMPCGVGDYTCRLAAALATQPETAVAVLTTGPSAEPIANVEVFPLMTRWSLREIGRFVGLVRQFSPDIVHLQYPTQGYAAGALVSLIPSLTKLLGVTLVRTWHEITRLKGGRSGLLRTLGDMAHAGEVIVVRPNFREQLAGLVSRAARRMNFRYIASASAIPAANLSAGARAEIRARYLVGAERLIAYFGFLYPHKGVELLFEIADPSRDKMVIIGALDDQTPYHRMIVERAERPPWNGRVCLAGYCSPAETATLLASADAVVLPFRDGAGEWNSSIHAAVLQGTPVVTTSTPASGIVGFDEDRLIDYRLPGDIEGMRAGLDRVAGLRGQVAAGVDEWQRIAVAHLAAYRQALAADAR